MVNSEELIGTTENRRYRRGASWTDVVITGFNCIYLLSCLIWRAVHLKFQE
jgi:hypothetical protein